MKIALYIEDGLEQIVLTPESATERAILEKIHDGSREISLKRGSFYECRGGWQRYTPASWTSGVYSPSERQDDTSTMIVLRPALAIETRQGGDGEAGSVEDESAGPQGQGPNSPTISGVQP